MIGCKVLILLVVISLTFNEILAAAVGNDFSDSGDVQPPYGEGVMVSGQTSFRVTRDKTVVLFGIAAAVMWFVKGT
jgi:hypothetical protein